MAEGIWLVTGGAGFIGSHIADRLVARGKKVRVLDNFSTGKREHVASILSRIDLVRGDIRSLQTCRRALRGVEVVIHQAAIRSVPKSVDRPTQSHEANATGTLNMLIASSEAKARRFVYASTSSAYGETTLFPQREEHPTMPVSPYAASKLCGEHYCKCFTKNQGLETIALRYFNVFGPRQDPESLYSAVIPKFMEQAYLGKPLDVHWDGKQSRDFTHISNVVQANLLAAESKRGVGETFNVANGKTYSLLDLIGVIEGIVGHRLARNHSPMRQGDVRKTYADISKARRMLGFRPVMNFDQGLKDTWDYFVSVYFKSKSR